MPVFLNREGQFSIRQNPEPLWNEVRLPHWVGIICNDDQSNNQIVVEEPINISNYFFNPEDDIALLSEYVEQLQEIYFDA